MSVSLIFRQIDYRGDDVKYSATTNDSSFNREGLWDSPKGDIERLLELCWNERKNHIQVHSLDIETVSWVPKAYEGFVYIIGLTSLLHDSIQVHQWININREKDGLVPILKDFFELLGSDSTLVIFSKSFDLPVLKKMIGRHGLTYEFPKKIIDPSKLTRELSTLEEEKLHFARKDTCKDELTHYAEIFKTKQQIDPFGIYNITDTLTPLLSYLRFEEELNQKTKIFHTTKTTQRRRTPSSLSPLDVMQMRLAQGEISIDEYKKMRSIILKDSIQIKSNAKTTVLIRSSDPADKEAMSYNMIDAPKKVDPSLLAELRSKTSFGIRSLVIRNKKVKLQFFEADEPKSLIALPKTKEDNLKVGNLLPGIKKRRCVIIDKSILPRVSHWEVSIHSLELNTMLFRIEKHQQPKKGKNIRGYCRYCRQSVDIVREKYIDDRGVIIDLKCPNCGTELEDNR